MGGKKVVWYIEPKRVWLTRDDSDDMYYIWVRKPKWKYGSWTSRKGVLDNEEAILTGVCSDVAEKYIGPIPAYVAAGGPSAISLGYLYVAADWSE